MKRRKQPNIGRIAVIGNYLPRQCGIATFTTDLCEALASEYKNMTCFAVPVNDRKEGYPYPARVRFEIAEQDLSSYRRAADFLNSSQVDLVSLQHEYGIFGGPAGSHILALLRDLRMPVFTTLHTVLQDPNPDQRSVLLELANLSDRLIVMSRHSVKDLQQIYNIPKEKIEFIPHGIPDVSFVDPNYYKDLFHVDGKTVLLTFGLLSPNKGIENVISALPEILKRHPDVVYLVLGATHPNVQRSEGETYRLSLMRLAETLGVAKNVIFNDRFVSLEQLVQFIGAADIYVTPYLNPRQSVSGTLAYTLGAGKAIVSTPYWYAEELLADGRGILVPFGDSPAIATAVLEIMENESKRHTMRKLSYEFGRQMIWTKVARRYMESFQRVREERARHPRPVPMAGAAEKADGRLPPIKLNHLLHMTDDTGMLQHAIFSVPNYAEGYTTDDNARALALTVALESHFEDKQQIHKSASRYLSFLGFAFNAQAKRFRNFLSYDLRWLEDIGSEDSHGRALWGLGTVLGRSHHSDLRGFANTLFHLALPAARELTSLRAWAFSLFGIHDYLKEFPGDRAAQQIRKTLASHLRDSFRRWGKPDWPWFEDSLTYCNAALPHALLLCGDAMSQQELKEISLKALAWLTEIQKAKEGHFVPIGSSGFYHRGRERARFDQQPVESQATISACLAAYRVTHDERWRKEAERAFDWYLGRNDLQLPLYDLSTGGCRDGLHPDRVNENQGAESTLSFLLSLSEMLSLRSVMDTVPSLKQLLGTLG